MGSGEPKQASRRDQSPLASKASFRMLDPRLGFSRRPQHADHIETNAVAFEAMAREKDLRSARDAPLFGPVDRGARFAGHGGLPGLDLDEHNRAAIDRHDIDLPAPKTAGHDLIALPAQKRDRRALAALAQRKRSTPGAPPAHQGRQIEDELAEANHGTLGCVECWVLRSCAARRGNLWGRGRQSIYHVTRPRKPVAGRRKWKFSRYLRQRFGFALAAGYSRSSREHTMVAGLPATTVQGGTSRGVTARAPTTAPAPIVTPGSKKASVHIQQSSSTVILLPESA